MPAGHSRPYQYVIVRVVPRVERGERLNAGVVVYSPQLQYLGARTALDPERLRVLAPAADGASIAQQLRTIELIAAGDADGGPIAHLDRGERFHWLASPASTVIQPSRIHTGLCDEPAELLDGLFARLVLPDGGE